MLTRVVLIALAGTVLVVLDASLSSARYYDPYPGYEDPDIDEEYGGDELQDVWGLRAIPLPDVTNPCINKNLCWFPSSERRCCNFFEGIAKCRYDGVWQCCKEAEGPKSENCTNLPKDRYCGSDNVTYCDVKDMVRESCKENRPLTLKHIGACAGPEDPDELTPESCKTNPLLCKHQWNYWPPMYG